VPCPDPAVITKLSRDSRSWVFRNRKPCLSSLCMPSASSNNPGNLRLFLWCIASLCDLLSPGGNTKTTISRIKQGHLGQQSSSNPTRYITARQRMNQPSGSFPFRVAQLSCLRRHHLRLTDARLVPVSLEAVGLSMPLKRDVGCLPAVFPETRCTPCKSSRMGGRHRHSAVMFVILGLGLRNTGQCSRCVSRI
jgi:hypothetical protein